MFNKSNKLKFEDLLEINSTSGFCNDNTLKSRIDTQPRRRYFFDKNYKLVEIKDDGTLRKVE